MAAGLGFPVPGLGHSRRLDAMIAGAHLAHRCYLFIILALGESILVIGAHLGALPTSPETIAAFVVAFAGIVTLWWIYFDRDEAAGLRVIDLGTVVVEQFASTLLGDFGAEVIKVEIPGRGDTLRQLGPLRDGASLWFAADARNKKSVTLDLRRLEGRALLLQLVTVADALVENFVPGTLDGWGLDGETLRAASPRLVIGRASGFGQTGPYRKRPGYNRVGVAFGGLLHLTGTPDGEPIRPGTLLADYLTGVFGAFGLMMALYYRDVFQGPAQEVDASLIESSLPA